jgi:hypothetical protein
MLARSLFIFGSGSGFQIHRAPPFHLGGPNFKSDSRQDVKPDSGPNGPRRVRELLGEGGLGDFSSFEVPTWR